MWNGQPTGLWWQLFCCYWPLQVALGPCFELAGVEIFIKGSTVQLDEMKRAYFIECKYTKRLFLKAVAGEEVWTPSR